MLDQSAYLRTIVDIGHLGARVDDEGTLLEASSELLLHGFGLVAVQVYLMDPSGLFGELRYHVGAGNRKRILRTPGVSVGSGAGLADVLAGGPGHQLEDLRTLPSSAVPDEAKTGTVLPLKVEGRVMGALVLYGAALEAALPADVASLVALADMLALALENVRERAAAGRGAEKHAPGRKTTTTDQVKRVQPLFDLEKPVSHKFTSGESDGGGGAGHTAPIKLRGSVVGSLSFEGQKGRPLGPDEVELIDSVADQVAQAIENLNLMENTQRLAQREQLINAITAQLQRATTVEDVLKTAAQAVRAALGNVEVTARLAPDAVFAPAEAELSGGARKSERDDEHG